MPAVEDPPAVEAPPLKPPSRLSVILARSGFLGALSTHDFAMLFSGQFASEIGNGLIQLALPWLVLELTGSAFQLGLAFFVQFLPMLLFGLVGGVFVDRWDRRMTIIVVDTIRALAFFSVGAIYYFDALTPLHLYAVIFLSSTLANFFNPARAALMPNLVSPAHLRSANSLMEVSRHVGFMVAPVVGGVMIDLIGPAALMLVDGASFLISAATVTWIGYRQPRTEPQASLGFMQAAIGVVDETAAGLKRIMQTHLLKVAILIGFALNVMIAPIEVLLPLFVVNVKKAGPDYFALLVAGLLVGLIAGSLTAPANSRRFGLGRITIGAVLVLGVVVTAAPWPPTPWPPFVAMALAGVAIGTLNVCQTTLLQGATTDDERGRISATYYTATLGVRPPGFLLMGILASAIDIRVLFSLVGSMALVLGLVLSRSEEVRRVR
ncbi:MAG TPA: MFS transporter [Dehalococcoidia bacterium]|nr:MFS transporter [Dehalococcoidia bacterium]